MTIETCAICGGDGRISNSFGLTTSCPSCHGSGRRADAVSGMRDVTKTKPSHYRSTKKVEAAGPAWPATAEGAKLATEVRDSTVCATDEKARLIRLIVEHESTHGCCTSTFQKKIRKQIRPKVP